MVYCAQIRAAFTTAARRDAVLADIQSNILTKPRWAGSAAVVAPDDLSSDIPGGEFGLVVDDLRFTARADADALRSRVQTFATGQRAPLPGSWLAVHDCPHDETPPRPCVVAPADRIGW